MKEKKSASFLGELQKWMEWNQATVLSFSENPDLLFKLPRFMERSGNTSCHQTDLAECSSLIPVSWKRCLFCLRLILLASARSAIPSCSLMASSHSGEFPLFGLLPISKWTCSSFNKWEILSLLQVFPLLFMTMIFLGDLNALAPLPCLPFNQTFI